jgi:hypothetical protein
MLFQKVRHQGTAVHFTAVNADNQAGTEKPTALPWVWMDHCLPSIGRSYGFDNGHQGQAKSGQSPNILHRPGWKFEKSLKQNI